MSHYRRKKVFGGYCFFTVFAYKRREFLTDDAVRPLLKEAFYDVRQKLPFKTHAFCLLPNHLHCLWQMPTESCDYSKRGSIIKRTFSKKYLAAGGEELQQSNSRRKKRESGVWQRRFWEHFIRDREDFYNHMHYIHYNPVKHEYCEHPEQWPYSTYQTYRDKIYHGFDWSCFTLDDFHDNIEFNE